MKKTSFKMNRSSITRWNNLTGTMLIPGSAKDIYQGPEPVGRKEEPVGKERTRQVAGIYIFAAAIKRGYILM
jgi:hypothetical protein